MHENACNGLDFEVQEKGTTTTTTHLCSNFLLKGLNKLQLPPPLPHQKKNSILVNNLLR